jgi:hypothetical protein
MNRSHVSACTCCGQRWGKDKKLAELKSKQVDTSNEKLHTECQSLLMSVEMKLNTKVSGRDLFSGD